MTTTVQYKRPLRSARTEAATHAFSVGQIVRLAAGFGRPAVPGDVFQITATLPPRGTSPQYRIRNEEERHERVATQDSLELIVASQGGAGETLLERTFGRG